MENLALQNIKVCYQNGLIPINVAREMWKAEKNKISSEVEVRVWNILNSVEKNNVKDNIGV